MLKKIIYKGKLASCYFRSSVKPPYRKVLLQITEKCNLHCAHCFVSASNMGNTMSVKQIRELIIPQLKKFKVISVTLTGGEPFIHSDIIEIIRLLRNSNIRIGVCTNGTLVKEEQIKTLAKIGGVHFNVSLDGFKSESHGKFRGNVDSFTETINTIRLLGKYHLLQGLLVTPNNLTDIKEYTEICEFAIKNNATYVLMNPLSSMGRGIGSKERIAFSTKKMNQIKKLTDSFKDRLEIIHIRFPNLQKFPLISCEAGNIIYVFTNGDLAICPYLVFAAKNSLSKYNYKEFVFGNIFKDADILKKFRKYNFHKKYHFGDNIICNKCHLNIRCGKGCPAAIIVSGKKIEEVDKEVCPLMYEKNNK